MFKFYNGNASPEDGVYDGRLLARGSNRKVKGKSILYGYCIFGLKFRA